jgi:hypothetical protein
VARLEVRRCHGQDGVGARGVFATIPGLGTAFKALTIVRPLGRGRVVDREGTLYVE